MRLHRCLGCVLVLLLCSGTAHAQTVTKYTLAIYNAGAPTPLSSPTDLLLVNITCGQVKPTGPTINPSKVSWDDPADATKACIWVDPGNGPLGSVPFGGNYEATLRAVNAAGASAESSRAPFTRPGQIPPVPTGLRAGS